MRLCSKKIDLIWQMLIGLLGGNTWKKSLAQGNLEQMKFGSFLGIEHLSILYRWIDQIQYPNFINNSALGKLREIAKSNDEQVFSYLELNTRSHNIDAVSLYNAQDFYLQHACPIPSRLNVKTFLDFGAGHGRQANIWLNCSKELETFIAVDAIPATYLTQRLYYRALGLSVNDYMEQGAKLSFGARFKTVHHLPSWRMDLVPDGSVDMICAVQVLRELSKPMLVYALNQFRRVLSSSGALYIRDHVGFHNVNQVDLDLLLQSAGFVLEWRPHVIDRVDIHGVPRVWRKADPEVFVGGYH